MASHMRRSRSLAAVLLALPIACGGGDGGLTEPDEPDGSDPQISSISVSPSSAELAEIGATETFEATALDAAGNEVPGASFTWSSSVSGVATVDADGTAIARANGATTIEAQADGVTDAATLTVRAGELAWTWISAGLINICGVTTHGTLYCWGNSNNGERGDGTISNFQATPVRVHRLDVVAQLAASGNHTCAVSGEEAAHCWGRNHQGQLGDGTTLARSTPVEVSGGLSAETIDAGTATTCLVTPEGAGYCWERGREDQLGNGSSSNQLEPVRVLEPWESG